MRDTANALNRLGEVLRGKVVVVGVGNRLRGDDAVGSLLAERLQKRLDAPCYDAGSTPENYLGKIIGENPDVVLMVDAVHLGREPGALEIMRPSEIVQSGLSTHTLSPRMACDLLAESIQGEVFLLGVQPELVALGSRMSRRVRESMRFLEERIVDVVSSPQTQEVLL